MISYNLILKITNRKSKLKIKFVQGNESVLLDYHTAWQTHSRTAHQSHGLGVRGQSYWSLQLPHFLHRKLPRSLCNIRCDNYTMKTCNKIRHWESYLWKSFPWIQTNTSLLMQNSYWEIYTEQNIHGSASLEQKVWELPCACTLDPKRDCYSTRHTIMMVVLLIFPPFKYTVKIIAKFNQLYTKL